ncbi:MAG TPA: hypothetical protein VFY69_07725 [Solirubrobacterales bacterium]|nr:hypothetical protein [Solirubrobacterales bacterium]
MHPDSANSAARSAGKDQSTFGRRELLLRAGALGAGAMVAGLWPLSAKADVPPSLQPLLSEIAGPAIDLLVYDTYAGLAVMAVPGPDRYSRAQGLTSATPGGIEAHSPDLIQHTLDFYIAWPDAYLHALAAAFREGVSDVPLPRELLTGPLLVLEAVGARMDDALKLVLANDQTVPASLPLAMLMNFAATQVRPSAVVGPTPSPFANLKWHEKGMAFQRIEQADPELVALIDQNAPQPLKEGASGLLRFAGGTLLELGGFATYTEWHVFDRRTRRATRRPLGWDLSRYMPGRTTPADGWPEFRGYYEGRTETHTAPQYGGP